MTLAILGMVMVALESYAWLFSPNIHASPDPITIGLPIVIATGVLARPATERTAILTFAAMLAVSLNRGLIPSPMLVHAFVFGGAVYLAWLAYRMPDANGRALRRLAVAGGVTLGGFVLLWLWQLL